MAAAAAEAAAAAASPVPHITADTPISVEVRARVALQNATQVFFYFFLNLNHIATPCGPAQLEEGRTYYYCTCGLSKNQPFCDGSVRAFLFVLPAAHSHCLLLSHPQHAGTSFTPTPFTAEKTETRYLCRCKQTKNAPFCDVRRVYLCACSRARVLSIFLTPPLENMIAPRAGLAQERECCQGVQHAAAEAQQRARRRDRGPPQAARRCQDRVIASPCCTGANTRTICTIRAWVSPDTVHSISISYGGIRK